MSFKGFYMLLKKMMMLRKENFFTKGYIWAYGNNE